MKKEGDNKGRWFYTCPKPRAEQCRFFLFENAAMALQKKTLEQKSVFSNKKTASANESPSTNTDTNNKPQPSNPNQGISRAETPQSEVASTVAGGPMFSPTSSVFPTPAPRGRIFGNVGRVPNPFWSSDEDSDDTADPRRNSNSERYPTVSTPTKRKRTHADDEVTARRGGNGRPGTVDMSEFDSDDDAQLAEMADQAERIHQSQSSQPSQRSQFSDSVATPSGGRGLGARTGLGGLPTPESGNSFHGASEPGAKRFKTAQGPQGASTPTPARTRNALAGGDLSQGDYYSDDDAEITIAVLGLLKAEPVSTPVRRALRETLNLHALKARGVERGRDVLREGLKTRDQRIADLQARVVKLEDERRARKVALKKAASDLQAWSQEDGED